MNIDLSEYFYFFTQVLLLASDLTVCLDFWSKYILHDYSM